MKPDLRLAPAALVAWIVAALAIRFSSRGHIVILCLCIALMFAAIRWAAMALMLAAAVGVAVGLSAMTQADAVVTCDGSVTITGVAQRDAVSTSIGSRAPQRLPVRMREISCGDAGTFAVPTAGSVVALGALGDVRRDSTVTLSGRMKPLPSGQTAHALLFDAEPLRVAPPGGVMGTVSERRAQFMELADGLSPQGRGLVPGVSLGEDSGMPGALKEAMIRSSLGHLTAVSGMHITLILLVVGVLAVRLSPRIRALTLVAILAVLVLVVGPEASVVRAVAMGTVGIVALARGRPPQALPALFVGIVVLLILDPWRAASLGFALSVVASAALVLLVRPLVRRVPERRRNLKRAVAVASVPFVAHLACAPIIVLFNPMVSMYGVLANALVIPAVPVATLAALGGFLTIGWDAPTWILLRIAEAATWWIATVAMFVSRLPFAAPPWWEGPGGMLLLVAAHLVILLAIFGIPRPPRGRHAAPRGGKRRRVSCGDVAERQRAERRREPDATGRRAARPIRRRALPWFAGIAALAVVAGAAAYLIPPRWTVWQCDVGQGAATLIRTGSTSAIMIDVGEADGRSQECLMRAGVFQLDLLVLTHPHADHVGNVPAVLASVPVREALVSPVPTDIAGRVEEELVSAHVPFRSAVTGMSGESGGVEWRVLWPDRVPGAGGAEHASGEPPGVNDASLAVLFTVGGHRILPLGDLETFGQEGLAHTVRQCGAPCQDLAVVVMAHHGSRTQSEELARLLRPALTLVGVGENSYGHPAPEALDLYESVDSRIWRTDLHGHIVVNLHNGIAEVVSSP